MENIANNYDDIINMSHHISTTHPHMSIHDRAAQFSPFAALTGYDDQVAETARITDNFKELDSYDLNKLDIAINNLLNIKDLKKINVTLTIFVPDTKKEGGKYTSLTGNIKRIDTVNKKIIMTTGNIISFNVISKIQINDNNV